MEYRQLSRSGLRVSVLSLGTMTFDGRGDFAKTGSTDAAGARRQLDMALDADALCPPRSAQGCAVLQSGGDGLVRRHSLACIPGRAPSVLPQLLPRGAQGVLDHGTVAQYGARATIATDGLVAPTGLAVSSSGEIYVSNFGVFSGAGEVVRITP